MNEIDVSKCQYYSKVDNCCHIFGNPLTATLCGYHKGCHYKQLQQLKQENEELKECIKSYEYQLEKRIEICDTWFDECSKLKQENEELKNKLSEYEDYGGIIDEGQAWANEAMGSRKVLEKLKPILEFYANMRIGFERANGTSAREVLLEAHNGGCHTGRFKMIYDPNKAKEGLEIIKSHLEDLIE